MSEPRYGDALVILAKQPLPGMVKTRLGATIGFESAAALYRAFLEDLRERFTAAARTDDYTLVWACAPDADSLAPLLVREGGAWLIAQRGEDLAERLYHVCVDLHALGYRRAVILGSDAPHLPSDIVAQAFDCLSRRDAVLGPAEDGGYYLVGVHLCPQPPDLFRGIRMSTPVVLQETLARARALACVVGLLKPHFDVDELRDLVRLAAALRADTLSAPATAQAIAAVCGETAAAVGSLASAQVYEGGTQEGADW
jgi:rSAM/selenodomain-associated transferase 1